MITGCICKVDSTGGWPETMMATAFGMMDLSMVLKFTDAPTKPNMRGDIINLQNHLTCFSTLLPI